MLSGLIRNQRSGTIYNITIRGPRKSGKTKLLDQLSKYEGANNYPQRFISSLDFVFSDETKNLIVKFLNIEVIRSQSVTRCRKIFDDLTVQSCGILFIFDVNDRKSFEILKGIVKRTEKLGNNHAIKILIANKSDLDREIPSDEILEYSIEKGMIYLEISTMLGYGIDSLLQILFSNILG